MCKPIASLVLNVATLPGRAHAIEGESAARPSTPASSAWTMKTQALALAVVLVSVLFPSEDARALVQASVTVECRLSSFSDGVQQSLTTVTAPSEARNDCGFAVPASDGYSGVSAFGYASHKNLYVSTRNYMFRDVEGEDRAVASTVDTLTIASSRLPQGTWGTATAFWYADTDNHYAPPPEEPPGSFVGHQLLSAHLPDGSGGVSVDMSGLSYFTPLPLSFRFQFGRPFTIDGTLESFGQSHGAWIEFHSVRANWGGFSSIEGIGDDGQPISPGAVTVLSESGVDWLRGNVPEPSTWAMLWAGAAALAWRLRLIGGAQHRTSPATPRSRPRWVHVACTALPAWWRGHLR